MKVQTLYRSVAFGSLLSTAFLAAAPASVWAGDIQERNFKVAIAVNAGTAHYDGGMKFCELLEKKSGGRMKAKMYGGGALGKDTAGLKIRVTETPLQIDFQTALGANPVPLPFVEVFSEIDKASRGN